MKTFKVMSVGIAVALLVGMGVLNDVNAKDKGLKPQETCPIMKGQKINKKLYADVEGYRIYVCCPGCLSQVKKDPQKAIDTLKAKGEKPEVRLALCQKCGEIKGTKKCCLKGAKKCKKCGLNKGSIACCRGLHPLEDEDFIVLCPKCGKAKGDKDCCPKDGVKCKKCGLLKNSPGCCKIDAYLNR